MLFFLFVVFGSLLAVNAQICLLDNCTLAGLQGVFFERSSIEYGVSDILSKLMALVLVPTATLPSV